MESHHDLISLFEHDLRANAYRVCREGKPVSTFPHHALRNETSKRKPAPHVMCEAGGRSLKKNEADKLLPEMWDRHTLVHNGGPVPHR
jgi:hypothetical protein